MPSVGSMIPVRNKKMEMRCNATASVTSNFLSPFLYDWSFILKVVPTITKTQTMIKRAVFENIRNPFSKSLKVTLVQSIH